MRYDRKDEENHPYLHRLPALFGGCGRNCHSVQWQRCDPLRVVSDDPAQSGDPVDVNINSDDQNDMNIQAEIPDESKEDPAQGADSSGLEQSIQADPVKPEQPKSLRLPLGPPLCRKITMGQMYRRRNARLRMRSLPPMRSRPQIPLPNRSLLPEAPTAPVRSMYPASVMWRTVAGTPAFRTMRCTKTATKSARWAAGINCLLATRRSQK